MVMCIPQYSPVLQAPLEGLGNSIWAMVLLALLGEFFWFFGIHGSNVTSAANNTLFMPGAIENASNVAAGLPATNAVNSYFLEAFKGPRHCVLSAMLAFMAKSKQLKAVGKIAVVPGLFGISEPMKFGIPMVFNPIILIPMSLAPVISLLIAYFAIKIGFMVNCEYCCSMGCTSTYWWVLSCRMARGSCTIDPNDCYLYSLFTILQSVR